MGFSVLRTPKCALEHDWIIRDAEGAFRALSAEGFARDYEPS
jgi:hypothetical protein